MGLKRNNKDEVVLASDGQLYDLTTLYKIIKDNEITRDYLELKSRRELQDLVPGVMTYEMFGCHMKEVDKCDLRISVLIDPNDRIIYGRMNLIKGVYKDKEKFFAVRFKKWDEMKPALLANVKKNKKTKNRAWWYEVKETTTRSTTKLLK